MSDYVEIAIEVKAITDSAVLVSDGDQESWIGFSVIQDVDSIPEVGEEGTISIPEWLAYKEGFI